MKKIAFVFPYAIVGGIETLFATLLKHLPEGFEYIALLPQGINPHWVSCNIINPQFYNTQSFKNDLARKLDAIEPDLIVGALNYNLGKALGECKKQHKVLETSHNVLGSAHDSIKIIHKHIIHVVSVSQSVAKHIGNVWTGSSSIILTGIDTEKFKPTKELNPFVKNYAYFGRLSDGDKYVKSLFKSFARIPAVLNVYGEAHTPREQAEYNKLVMGTNVHLKGFVTNPEHHMQLNDVVVIRSEAEGFCNTAAEAFACGVPLVAWNFGGVLDHAPDRACLKANTQESFEMNLRIVKDHSLRQEMRRVGLEFIQTTCNASAMSNSYYKLFQELLGPAVVNVKTTAVCTQLSTSIQHSMEEYADEVKVVPYEDKIVPFATRSKKVIVNAAGKNYRYLICELAKTKEVYTIYHGSFCSFSFKYFEGERHNLQTMLDLQKGGFIKKIGFVNEGSAEFYKSLGYNTCWTPNIPMAYRGGTKLPGINIGVFSSDVDIKNTVTAVSCALCIPDVTVHTIHPIKPVPGISPLRIKVHGRLPKEQLLTLMGQMNLTLMLSFSESYGLLVTQSMAMGTPCIVGTACRDLVDQRLVVERLDDAALIVEMIKDSLNCNYALKAKINNLREVAIRQREEFLK